MLEGEVGEHRPSALEGESFGARRHDDHAADEGAAEQVIKWRTRSAESEGSSVITFSRGWRESKRDPKGSRRESTAYFRLNVAPTRLDSSGAPEPLGPTSKG